MKKRFSIILALAGLMTFSSCHNELDIQQNSQLSSSSMWTEESDATSAMLGAHARMRAAFNQGLMYWGEYRTGLWGPGNHKGLSQAVRDRTYQNTMDQSHTYSDWENLYTTINQANLVIKYTPQISFTNEQKKNEVLANAYFIRATTYYWIARIWGDAPLVLEGFESASQELRPTRSTQAKILASVESDINKALELMPQSVNAKKTASLGSINMLKADFSLWMYKVQQAGENYLNAAQEATQAVINSGRYTLESDYGNVFATATESGPEVIYAWNYEQGEYLNGYPVDFQFNSGTVSPELHYNPIVVGTSQQWTFYTDAYKDIIVENPDDKRLPTNYQSFYDEGMNQNFEFTNKYKGSWINGTLVLDSDIILYRLADAYLMDAEVKYYKNDTNGALASLNVIAERAYGVSNYYTAQDAADFKALLVKERLKEFPAEGKLWWDLIRLDEVFNVNPYLAGKENQTNILLWPVSQNSLNDNPNLGGQTEGW